MTLYTDSDAIAAYLGVTLTPEQEAYADQLAAAVTTWIDRYTGRSWQGSSPGQETANVLPSPATYPAAFGVVYLLTVPVTTVTGVALRTGLPNDTPTALDADEYELVDPTAGLVTLSGGYGWSYPHLLAVVDFTYPDTVPADVELAATMLAAGELSRTLAIQRGSEVIANNPQLAGLESISVGQNDVSVKLGSTITGTAAAGTSAAGSGWAATGSAVASLLAGYRRVVIA